MKNLDIHLHGEHVATTTNLELAWTATGRQHPVGQTLLSVRLFNWVNPPPAAWVMVKAHLGSLLPEDGTNARSRLADRAGSWDIEALLSVAGLDVPGGEIIVPAGAAVPPATYEPLDEAGVADYLAHAALGEHGASSLPGMQPKGALALLGGVWHRSRGSGASTHILKPAREDAPEIIHDEALSSRAAAACGVPSAISQVVTIAGGQVLAVPRFDRRVEGDSVVRIHAEDGASALGLTPDEANAKFEWARDAANLRALAAALSRNGGERLDLLRQTTMRVLLGDTDAHAKNHTLLLHEDGTASLAPLYDASPHGQRGGARMAMFINGKSALSRVTLDDVAIEANRWGIRPAIARREVTAVREAFVDFLDHASPHPLSAASFEWVATRMADLAPPSATTTASLISSPVADAALPKVSRCGAPIGPGATCKNPTTASRCHLHA